MNTKGVTSLQAILIVFLCSFNVTYSQTMVALLMQTNTFVVTFNASDGEFFSVGGYAAGSNYPYTKLGTLDPSTSNFYYNLNIALYKATVPGSAQLISNPGDNFSGMLQFNYLTKILYLCGSNGLLQIDVDTNPVTYKVLTNSLQISQSSDSTLDVKKGLFYTFIGPFSGDGPMLMLQQYDITSGKVVNTNYSSPPSTYATPMSIEVDINTGNVYSMLYMSQQSYSQLVLLQSDGQTTNICQINNQGVPGQMGGGGGSTYDPGSGTFYQLFINQNSKTSSIVAINTKTGKQTITNLSYQFGSSLHSLNVYPQS